MKTERKSILSEGMTVGQKPLPGIRARPGPGPTLTLETMEKGERHFFEFQVENPLGNSTEFSL